MCTIHGRAHTFARRLFCVCVCVSVRARALTISSLCSVLCLQLVDFIWPAMMDALGKEPDADVQSAHLDSIAEILELVSHVCELTSQVHTQWHVSACTLVYMPECG